MRILATALLVASLVISGFANDKNNKPAAEADCVAPTHPHQYGEIRIALIEVTNVSSCGFDFADLEAQTVGPSNALLFARDFEVVEIGPRNKTEAMVKFESSRQFVRKGLIGLATYCSVCKAVFSFRQSTSKRDGGISIDE